MISVDDESSTLFLGDLSCFCQEKDVIAAFQRFGEIKQIRLMRSKQDGQCLGYGFICFNSVSSAVMAMEIMNGHLLLGRPLRIKPAIKHKEGGALANVFAKPKRPNYLSLDSAEIHFSFVSKQTNYAVTEETLRSIFSEFGPVQDISIKKTCLNQRGEQTGYGFIHFPLNKEGIGAAIQASTVICQCFVDNVLYDCCLTKGFVEYLQTQQSYKPVVPQVPAVAQVVVPNSRPTLEPLKVPSPRYEMDYSAYQQPAQPQPHQPFQQQSLPQQHQQQSSFFTHNSQSGKSSPASSLSSLPCSFESYSSANYSSFSFATENRMFN